MIKPEKLKLMFSMFVEKNTLNFKDLKECGMLPSDIRQLRKMEVLVQIDEDNFILKSKKGVKGLYDYAHSRISDGADAEEIVKIYEKCYELDSNNFLVCYQLLTWKISLREFDNTFYDCLKFAHLYQGNDKNYDYEKSAYINLYIYLLNHLIDNFDEDLSLYAQNMSLEDLKLQNENDSISRAENRARELIFKEKFSSAHVILKKFAISYKINVITIKNVIGLLEELIIKELERDKKILELIKEKRYDVLLGVLKGQNNKFRYKSMRSSLIKVTEEIIKVQNTGKISKVVECNTENTFCAIDNNDFLKAFELEQAYIKKYGKTDNEPLYILLTELCYQIGKLEKNERNQKKMFFEFFDKDGINEKKVLEYLELIGKKEYFQYLICYIKLDIVRGDRDFYLSNREITKLNSPQFYLDMKLQIRRFENYIIEGRVEEAKVMYELIKNYYIPRAEDKENRLEELKNKLIEAKKYENMDEYEKLLANKYKELMRKRSFVLLDEMPHSENLKILEYVSSFKNMDAFLVGPLESERVVLRYRVRKYIKMTDLIEQIKLANIKGDFQKVVELNMIILHTANEVKSITFAKIGLALIKMKKLDSALEYLNLATLLSKREDGADLDFTELLSDIETNMEKQI